MPIRGENMPHTRKAVEDDERSEFTEVMPLWRSISPILHIVALIFGAGVAFAGYNTTTTRVDKLEASQTQLNNSVHDLEKTNARIEQKLDDVRYYMGIPQRQQSEHAR
jgi:anti-sigma-K factor RskA